MALPILPLALGAGVIALLVLSRKKPGELQSVPPLPNALPDSTLPMLPPPPSLPGAIPPAGAPQTRTPALPGSPFFLPVPPTQGAREQRPAGFSPFLPPGRLPSGSVVAPRPGFAMAPPVTTQAERDQAAIRRILSGL